MKRATFKDSPNYEALSYTWGLQQGGNSSLHVTNYKNSNLQNSLRDAAKCDEMSHPRAVQDSKSSIVSHTNASDSLNTSTVSARLESHFVLDAFETLTASTKNGRTFEPSGLTRTEAPRVSPFSKGRELVRFGVTRLRVSLHERASSTPRHQRPLSKKGLFARNYVDPLFTWWGANERVLMSQSLGCVDVEIDAAGTVSTAVVNGASHNYAGFYLSFPQAEALQSECLQTLPVSHSDALPLLRDAVHNTLARFFGADFGFTCSTGYGSNMLALPALLAQADTVVMDGDCHNSMYTGAFLADRKVLKFGHNDMPRLETILSSFSAHCTNVLVCIEGLYSMGGDVPPLSDLHRLKRKYGFTLYCDEAYSFMSLGRTGRGCLEFWNEKHPDTPVPKDLIDLRTGTLSKAVGGIGGFIVGKRRFEAAVRAHLERQEERESLSLLTSTMVQTLWVLERPNRTARNLQRLSEIATFCRAELLRRGIHVYGDDGTPVLPVWAGRPSVAARLSYELRRAGLLASPVATPAVPSWESRVRVNLTADYTDGDVDRLLTAITSAAERTGTRRRPELGRERLFTSTYEFTQDATTEDTGKAFHYIRSLVRASSTATTEKTSLSTSIEAGHASRAMYGIGSGSARWISGTFASYLAVEAQVARIAGTEASLTHADPSIGLASTIAALTRPLHGFRTHLMFYPKTRNQYVREGLRMVPPRSLKSGGFHEYGDLDQLVAAVREQAQRSGSRNTCLTI